MSVSIPVNLDSMTSSLPLDRRRASIMARLPATSMSFVGWGDLDGTSSSQRPISPSRAASQLDQDGLPSPSTPSNIKRPAAPLSSLSSSSTNLANPSSSSVSSAPATRYGPEAHLELTDLDLLVTGLDISPAAANAGSSYEDLWTISSIIGLAQAGPTSEMKASAIENLPVARIEVERRRKTKDGRTKLKLSLMGVVVDRCVVCLFQFKKLELGVLLPCRHSFHPKCVHPWLRQNMTCPSCRTSIIQT